MTVSGQTVYAPTALEIIEAAFNNLGVGQEGEALTPRMYADGKRALNMLILTFNAHPRLWIYTEGTVTMVTEQASYALTDPRPLRITSIRRRLNGIDTPLNMMSRQEYFDQPNKTVSPSIPVSFYFDPQVDEGTLYLWPAPSATAVGQYSPLRFTYIRRMNIVDDTANTLDLPQEWVEPVTWNLAKRLMPQYPVNDPNLAQLVLGQAAEYYNNLLQWDNEPASIYMGVDYQAWPDGR